MDKTTELFFLMEIVFIIIILIFINYKLRTINETLKKKK